MTEEELDEALEYNLEYLEARLDEDLFGGDYTSAVELRHVNDELERTEKQMEMLYDENSDLRWELNLIKRKIRELENFHKKRGEYIIPVEIMNDLLGEYLD